MEYNKTMVRKILNTGIAMSREKDRIRLLNMILDSSIELTNCDAGTLYFLRPDGLHFKIMKTLSMGVDRGSDGAEIDLPPVPLKEENICAYTVLHGEPLNVPDVYHSDRFDFSGPKRYDAMTGYHTQSMMTIPLINQEDKAVGVLQLINAMDEEGTRIPFSEEMEFVLLSLASQAAIAVSNMEYQEELKDQMWSFTEAMTEAVDARTPYNGSHSRMVAKYAGMLADYINEMHAAGKEEDSFSKHRKEQLVMGGLLHDIGKMIVPIGVMNKATRMEQYLPAMEQRFSYLAVRCELDWRRGDLSQDQYEAFCREIAEAKEVTDLVNNAGFLDDALMERVNRVLSYQYQGPEETIPFFSEEEKVCMQIRRGTLTEEERRIMESHVEMTERILSKVHFNSYFRESPIWAVQHHECLDGHGYPHHLTADDLKLESRILAVADICDALLATDRPYKKPLPRAKAFAIMRDMASQGRIEMRLVDYMEACLAREPGERSS